MHRTMSADLQATLEAKGPAAAMALCRERLEVAPRDADAYRYLAQLHAFASEFSQAIGAAQRACELAPEDARGFSELARVHALQGQYAEAAYLCEHAVRIDPRYADGWHNLGTARRKLGDAERAFTALKYAVLIDPTRADTWLNLGNLLIAADQFADAVECFERAAKHDPGLAAARNRLAAELSIRGKVKRAESVFRQSLGLNPDHVESWFGLGRTLEDLGEAEGATSCYLNVFARQPGHAAAIGRYLSLVSEQPRPDVLVAAQRILDNTGDHYAAKALAGYGLAKFHDRRREFSQAAAAGRRANAARRGEAGPLDRLALSERVDGIIRTYTSQFFEERRHFGLGNDQPVFIVGLPRSGTTLTEHILSAHPRLHGAGELTDLARIAARCVTKGEEIWQAPTRLDKAQSRARAGEYLQALQERAAKQVLRISDKSPLNFFQLAFVALLFPQARVIHCIRDARDNALSIWMENFNPDQCYATDLADLAFFRSEYQRLMSHWHEHLPVPILELHYEETVADLERQARKLIDFLDAPWNASCLNFHKSNRAVQTPSRWQVRQPVYTGSAGRWRNYALHLPELEAAFPQRLCARH
jgi:tetratricopeptide (TPR) repeat protein